MTKQKSTRKMLLSSILSLALCISMLIGTTFAWFTDNVTSANNIIKSGNLDVELEYSTDLVTWTKVDENTNIFKDGALWEPGYTEVVYLRVSNAGSLALKYQLGINVVSETPGENQQGDSFKLSHYIEYGVVDDVTAKYASREDAVKELGGNSTTLATAYSKEDTILAKADPDVVALVVYMPESVGNEANHNGTVPEIKLGLNVFATQLTNEKDSFDDQYDADAVYGTVVNLEAGADLLAAMASAEAGVPLTINLRGNVEWPTTGHNGVNDITPASAIIINGKGNTITATGAGVTALGDNEAPMTLKNVTIKDESVSYAENAWEFSYLELGGKQLNCENVEFVDPIMVESEKAIFNNCSFLGYEDTNPSIKMNGVWMYNGDATFTNCKFEGTRGIKICDMYTGGEVGTVVIDNCRFIGLTQKPGVAIDDRDTQDMKITIKNSTFIGCQPGDQGLYIYETDNTVPVVENNTVDNESTLAGTKNDLKTAISEAQTGETIILTDDINYENDQFAFDKPVTLDLNGKELTTANNWGGTSLKNGASIKNGTINHNGNTAAIKAFNGCTIENVTINITPDATNKVVTGIAVQQGANVESIENVMVNGASQGIEVGYQARVGVIKNAKVNASTNGTAQGTALVINGGRVDSAINCEFIGEVYGANVYLKGIYDVALSLINCKVSGATGIWAHDEVGVANAHCGTVTVSYDVDSAIHGGINWDFEEECKDVVTLNAPQN